MRVILLAAILALAGCELDEPTIGGTIVSVMEAELGEQAEGSPKYYEDPLVPEVAWRLEVQLDDGNAVSLTHEGARRYEPGERVRLLKDEDGELLL